MTDNKTKKSVHPSYLKMIESAITMMAEKKGSSRQAISKYIRANYSGIKDTNVQINTTIRKAVVSGDLVQKKASFLIGKKKETEAKIKVKAAAAKAKAREAVKVKKVKEAIKVKKVKEAAKKLSAKKKSDGKKVVKASVKSSKTSSAKKVVKSPKKTKPASKSKLVKKSQTIKKSPKKYTSGSHI
jgi:histone H1/5